MMITMIAILQFECVSLFLMNVIDGFLNGSSVPLVKMISLFHVFLVKINDLDFQQIFNRIFTNERNN